MLCFFNSRKLSFRMILNEPYCQTKIKRKATNPPLLSCQTKEPLHISESRSSLEKCQARLPSKSLINFLPSHKWKN